MADWLARAHDALTRPTPKVDPEERRFRWMLYRRGLPPLEVRFMPELALREVMELYPGATCEPLPDVDEPEAPGS